MRRNGTFVGTDEFGNTYYKGRHAHIDPSTGPERRWVIYNGEAELSRVPPSWRGWLAHTHNIPPSQETYVPREWEMPHKANLTGTAGAYRPPGSIRAAGPPIGDRRLRSLVAGQAGTGRAPSGGPSGHAWRVDRPSVTRRLTGRPYFRREPAGNTPRAAGPDHPIVAMPARGKSKLR